MAEPAQRPNVPPEALQPRSHFALWLGIVGPPLVWLTHFQVKYTMAGVGNAPAHGPLLLATSVIAGALVLFLGYIAARERKWADVSPLDETAGIKSRNRFMATLGVMSAGLFLLVIIAQAIADFFFLPGLP